MIKISVYWTYDSFWKDSHKKRILLNHCYIYKLFYSWNMAHRKLWIYAKILKQWVSFGKIFWFSIYNISIPLLRSLGLLF